MKPYVLAYDFGTSGAKCVLVTAEGKLLSSATAGYPLYTDGGPNWAEQAPEDYWQAVCRTTKEVLTGIDPAAVAGIAFGTMWKGIIPIDKHGNVLRRAILWMDGRASSQTQKLIARFGVLPGPVDYWSKLLWLRENEPEILENAEWVLETNAYLKWRATGELTVDISNNYAHSFDPKLDAFYEELFAFMDIPREKFPRYVKAWDLVGRVTEQAATELGVEPGTPVFGGNNDFQGVATGAGCSGMGDVHAYFGSSGWIGIIVPHEDTCATAPLDPDRSVCTAGMKAVGLSQNWMVRNLYADEYAQMGDRVFSLIDHDAAKIPAGSEGLMATPWLYGEYYPNGDLNTGGCFLNLRYHHTRSHMVRAMMESICYHLKQRLQWRCENKKSPWPTTINAVGGGACSDVWMQILSDVLNVPIRVPENPRHAGALGTAYNAIIGLGLFRDDTELAKKLPILRTYTPDPAAVAAYEKYYGVYTQLYKTLKPISDQLNAISPE